MPLTFIHHKKDKITTVGSLTNRWVRTYCIWCTPERHLQEASWVELKLDAPPVLSHSMHFKRTLLWKVFPIMPGTSKYPFWAESHCVMGSLKGPLRGKASELVEVRLPWGQPLNLEKTRADWMGSPGCHGNPAACRIPNNLAAPVRGGPDMVNNNTQPPCCRDLC